VPAVRLVLVIGVALVWLSCADAGSASAQTIPRSSAIALIPDDGSSSSAGVLPTSGTVAGDPGDSFDQFSFTNVDLSQVGSGGLAGFDTAVLRSTRALSRRRRRRRCATSCSPAAS
jgi:hypothetical protein